VQQTKDHALKIFTAPTLHKIPLAISYSKLSPNVEKTHITPKSPSMAEFLACGGLRLVLNGQKDVLSDVFANTHLGSR